MINIQFFSTPSQTIRAEVKYQYGKNGRKSLVNNYKSMHGAMLYVDQVVKNILRDKIRTYVNHRERILLHHGGKMDGIKRAAINRIITQLNLTTNHGLKATLTVLLNLKEDCYAIIPGNSSVYHQHDVQLLAEIFSDCLRLKEEIESVENQFSNNEF